MQSKEFTTITATADGRTGRLRLNRPARLNPLSDVTLREIASAARWFDSQLEVTVVIVTGEGRAFSAGADLSTFSGPSSPDRDAADAGRLMAEALEQMRALAIVGLHGWCVGGGLVVALACDIRIAADDAQFSIPEVDLGIPLAWGGIPRMVREIGPALTKELVLTCRPFTPHEGQAAGFINEVVAPAELDARVEALAAQLVTKAPLTIFATKRHVNAVTEQMVGTNRSWSDADSLVAALGDPECRAARKAYLAARS